MKNRYEVKVTDEWARDFAERNDIKRVWYAKLLLRIAVGFDNLVYVFERIKKRR